ncbi:hypothetical protein Cadr_000023928 [Camelus dromedarius]|uniref:Uncharacterized protein n=1 Tax=Camelus dromedarius TaxID=9838 RepID=A0A5N4CWU8_CAMDR|nr:hypothetical protein Cadr_000023928 [Camelus dromedarius]
MDLWVGRLTDLGWTRRGSSAGLGWSCHISGNPSPGASGLAQVCPYHGDDRHATSSISNLMLLAKLVTWPSPKSKGREAGPAHVEGQCEMAQGTDTGWIKNGGQGWNRPHLFISTAYIHPSCAHLLFTVQTPAKPLPGSALPQECWPGGGFPLHDILHPVRGALPSTGLNPMLGSPHSWGGGEGRPTARMELAMQRVRGWNFQRQQLPGQGIPGHGNWTSSLVNRWCGKEKRLQEVCLDQKPQEDVSTGESHPLPLSPVSLTFHQSVELGHRPGLKSTRSSGCLLGGGGSSGSQV